MDKYENNIFRKFVDNQFENKTKKKISRQQNKWTSLEHNGVKFPEKYKYKHIPIIYDGKEIYLSEKAEEYAFLYAKYIGTDYVLNNTFNKNFFNDWKKVLGNDTEIKSLAQCDFRMMKQYLDDEKERKKEERKTNSEKNDNDSKYKIAIVDGKEQEITNYKMEPPGIFIGRGKNPYIGKVKSRIEPEDIILNLGVDAKIPKPPEGHEWEEIIHDRKVEWLASWLDSITGKRKYMWLSAHSELKTINDQRKFDLAKKLKKKIGHILEINRENMKSDNEKIMQTAIALYLIDKLAIRVGNEKGEDETDTVGVTSLRVEHLELEDHYKITLNFLGKDSVPYTNTIEVDELVYNNLKKLIDGKDKYDDIFDKINSNDVNKYLQEFMKNLTAKVFRTYNASNMFQKELRKINKKMESYIGDDKNKILIDEYIKANLKVAKLMNHQKNISVGYKKNIDKINNSILELKKKLIKVRRKKTRNQNTINKLKDKIKNLKNKKELVKEMKNMSLNTSKANYIDPRITVAFIKKHNLDVDKLFSTVLQKKFAWAFDVDENYIF